MAADTPEKKAADDVTTTIRRASHWIGATVFVIACTFCVGALRTCETQNQVDLKRAEQGIIWDNGRWSHVSRFKAQEAAK